MTSPDSESPEMPDPISGKIVSAAAIEGAKLIRDDPAFQPARNELAKAAHTLTKTINVALLPLAAITFGFEKARTYFEEKFPQEIAEKAASIPPEDLVEPKASVAGPALQGLAFSHEEPELKEMYLNLLKTAVDGRVSSTAHPAFVEIIRQLDADGAKLLGLIFPLGGPMAIAEIRLMHPKLSGYKVLLRHVLSLINPGTGQPVEVPNLDVIIDNWIRLELVTVAYDKMIKPETTAYEWVGARPEYRRLQETHRGEQTHVEFHRGVLEATAFGKRFAEVVGIISKEVVVVVAKDDAAVKDKATATDS